jgi:hypothetical protein
LPEDKHFADEVVAGGFDLRAESKRLDEGRLGRAAIESIVRIL